MPMTPLALIKIDTRALANCVVFKEDGSETTLATLWAESPAILVFLRHFACVACRAHAAQVWSEREKYQQNAAKIYFIGNGSPSYIQRFKEDLGLTDATVLTDPKLRSFFAAGFKRGFLASHGAKSIANGTKLLIQGHKQKLPNGETGDIWQLGGVLVVKPPGIVIYQFTSEALGDFPPSKDVEDAADHVLYDDNSQIEPEKP